MSDSKGKAVIGAFVVGAVALAVTAVLVLGSGDFMKKKLTRVMYFESSVKGLKVGAPVVFHGVVIGDVTKIAIQADPKDWSFKVPVYVEIEPDIYRRTDTNFDDKKFAALMINHGLRARLELQSVVTGMLQIELAFLPDTEAHLVGGDSKYIEIPTVESGLEKLANQLKELNLKDVVSELSKTLVGIRELVTSQELRESIRHLNETLLAAKEMVHHADTQLVTNASQMFEHADQMVVGLDSQLRPLVGKADKTVADIDKLVNNVDQAVVPLTRKIETTADAFTTTAEAVRPALKKAERALANIEAMTRKGSQEREGLDDVLKELSAAARAIKNWAEYLERHPEALIMGKGNSRKRR